MEQSNVTRVATSCLVILGFLAGCNAAAKEPLPAASGAGSNAPPVLSVPTIASATPTSVASPDGAWRAVGSTRPIREADVSSTAAGVLTKVAVAEGDQVKQGQLLFHVDSGKEYLDVKQARVALQAAEHAHTQAQRDLLRSDKLFKQGAVTRSEHELAKYQERDAELAVERAKVSVRTANRGASETSVRAPIGGVVSKLHFHHGESVAKNGSAVLRIEDVTQLEVRARLPERTLSAVAVGTPIVVVVQALKRTVVTKVHRLSTSIDEATRTFELIALLPNDDGKLMAGMLVEVRSGAGDEQQAAKEAAPAPSGSAR